MKRKQIALFLLFFLTFLARLPFAQSLERNRSFLTSLKPGFGFEYFSRAISWDDKKYTSKLKAVLAYLDAKYEIQEGFSASLLLGYCSSNWNGLVFRKLPFSTDYEAGRKGGILIGAEIRKSLPAIGNFEIEGYAQFVTCLGLKKEWDLESLNTEGKVKGTPYWMRAAIGPIVTYTGFKDFYPYIYPSLNMLWGKYKMEQTVQDLIGKEDKMISGKSVFSLALGSLYEITDQWSVKGEISLLPYKAGLDIGLRAEAFYSF
jgi:hypothetical protein